MQDLNGLISDLRALYAKISVLRLRSRMETRRSQSGSAADVDVAGRLKTFIGNATPEDTESDAQAGTKSDSEGPTFEEQVADFFGEKRQLFEDLSNWWRQRGSGTPVMEPYMGEKLQKSAMEHINRALRLAKQGKVKAAEVHAELAESAVKAAAQYMEEPEYGAFKAQVQERLGKLLDDAE